MNGGSIVITGIGPVGPVGTGRDELAAALDEGLEPVDLGEIHLEDYLETEKTYLDPNSELTLCSASLALADARVTVDDENAGSVGMSFGTRLGNVTTSEAYMKMVREQGVKLASPLLFIHAYPNTSVSLTAIEFGIKGASYNFNSGRWCGLQALTAAADELRRGKMSVMLAGAADTYTEVTRPDAIASPFRAAATLVLERAAEALRRGVGPSIEFASGGLAATIEQALSRALRRAAAGRPELDWVLLDAPQDLIRSTDFRTHTTELPVVVGDCGAATAMLGVAIAAIAVREEKSPVGFGPAEAPRTVAVVSADKTGAAAVILRKLAD